MVKIFGGKEQERGRGCRRHLGIMHTCHPKYRRCQQLILKIINYAPADAPEIVSAGSAPYFRNIF